MQKSKSYKFEDKTDYIFYLSEIIIDLIQRKERIELCLKEANSILINNPSAKLINSNLYDSISDTIIRPLQYIFNLLGDESKQAVSYKKFRKLLFVKRNILGIDLNPLSDEENRILNEFNLLRNWSLHIPESIYTEKKTFFKINSDFIIENKNKIIIPKYENFEIKFLENFKKEMGDVLIEIEKILSRMKDDYRIIIGEDFEIEYEQNHYKSFAIMDIVSNSWDIQIKKDKN
jgi:hypothetical protein